MPGMYTGAQVGAALKRARKAAGLTQEAVAKALSAAAKKAADGTSGVTKSMISEWETGARDPQTSNLLRLLDFYGVSLARWERLLQKESEDAEPDEDPAEALEHLTERVTRLEAALTRRPGTRLRL